MNPTTGPSTIRDHSAAGDKAALPERPYVFWRVEGSLLNLTAVRPVGFFAWNAQSFLERWVRRGLMGAMAVARPVLYLAHRRGATRALHTVLRDVSRDRLDLLGEEYFELRLKPSLKREGVELLGQALAAGANVVLVSQGLDHIMQPLAAHLGVRHLLCNRLEFRDGMATGRLLDPVIRPRGPMARFTGRQPDGRVPQARLLKNLGFAPDPSILERAIRPATREHPCVSRPVVEFPGQRHIERLSVRRALAGRHVLLVGVTGFIGKVWLANLLEDVPEIGKVTLLVRRHKGTTGAARFQRIVEESPVFDALHDRYGERLGALLGSKTEVIEGDVSEPGLGLAADVRQRLERTVDLVVNSSGLTDFNPDLRDALAANVNAVMQLVEFLRGADHAALLHLSTCYVAGGRDGRVTETLAENYTPVAAPAFDAEEEWKSLRALAVELETQSDSAEVAAELEREARTRPGAARDLHGASLEIQIKKNRKRWLRQALTDAGLARAQRLGWPNTYTMTKSLAESLLAKYGAGLPIAIVRPAIVESSLEKPFRGWNEGINTSASLSYLLGTFFRQLPTNERKRLDIIPVDQVTRGMTLVGAALVERCHAAVYHLATSVTNPCDMRRSIELTGLAHRKHYRTQNGFHHWLRSRFDPIPVSKSRYERLSAPAQKAIVGALARGTSPLPFLRQPFLRRERELERTEKLIELFEPFILRNEHVFEAENIERLAAALVPEERAAFGYDVRSIDWWDYWINVHIPALRRWSYPLIEGRALEPRARRPVTLAAAETATETARAAPASRS